MNSFLHRAAVVFGTALFVFSLPIAHMAPTAFAAPPNPGLDAMGQWSKPGPGFVSNATTEPGEHVYIIGHQAPSLAQYKGDISGLAATSPTATGAARLDADSAASQAYLSYLDGLHSGLASAIQSEIGRNVDVRFEYDAVFNGIAVELTSTEAHKVSSLAGVRSVTRDYSRELHTDNGPHWIGADVIWGEGDGQLPDGAAACVGNCGEGIVAGIIDTGVNFDHPSFADVGGDGFDHDNPRGTFYGACDPVTGAPFCNDKLIGFYDFTGTSPIDDNGHGSHTASTTAGNVLTIQLEAPTITIPRSISGVAPHANIISYKGCSGTPVGCLISALIGSINQATLDGVDVINYSIGGSSANPWADLDAQAFFDAYTAGIFVATSASNDGPGFGTLGSPADAPWVTSVGASTHDRKLANGIVDMTNADMTDGPADIFGASLTAPLPPARVVYAGDYGAPLCGAGTGDPATGEGSGGNPFPAGTFNGEIVVCDRGEYGRVHKSENVHEAGAGGYVLANDEANGDSLVGDAYPLPGVHISYANGLILKQWIDDNGALSHQGTARINGSNPDAAPENGDIMASFSSRGANPAAPSLIKPDVTAPGVDILAAWMADPAVTAQDIVLSGSDGEQYGVISGTSMSSPHTAGAGALIRAVHPDWSPDEVKSALMTTAFNTMANGNNGDEVHGVLKEDSATPADPFDMGAGRVDLHVAADAGFVLDETAANYEGANPAIGDVTTLNIASLGNDDCGTLSTDGSCSWTRTIKGTAPGTVSWTVTTSGEAGMVISASPNNFTLSEGEELSIEFTADVSASPKGAWIFGEVRFLPSGSVPPAHFPVAVIPQPPGGGGGVELYMHGNGHDACDTGAGGTYSGDGGADVLLGCVPFLSEDDQLDPINDAATWGPLQPGLNGPAFDPRWVWEITDPEGIRLAGLMTVEWWASQATTDTGILFDTNFDITVTVDGVPHIVDHRVGHTFLTPGQPQKLRSVVPFPDITAFSTVDVMIEPVFIDSGNTVTFYYDSEAPCIVGGAGSCDSMVKLPVIDEPLPPIANDDFVSINNGDTTVIDVLANDFDPEGGPLAVEIISGPANGTAGLNADNLIIYTHNGSATSSDTIVYRVTDNDGLTAEATVHISIAGACTPAPDYFIDFESGAPGWTVDTDTNLDPTSNTWDLRIDPTAISPFTAYNTDANGQDATQTADVSKDVRLVSPEFLVSGGTVLSFWHQFFTEDSFDGGLLEVSTDGGATWQDILDAGGTFIQGGYNSTIAVLNSRPGWSGISPSYPDMNEVQVNLATFNSEDLMFRFRMIQDVLLGQPGGGWSIDDVGLNNLFESCDNTGGSAPVANNDADSVAAGGSVNTVVKGNDSDPDNTDLSGHTVTIQTAPNHGTAVVETDGSITYTHTGTTETSDTYEYRLTDPEGNFDTAIVSITIVQPNNQPPVANDDAATVDDGQSVTIDVKGNDSDPDHSNAELTVTIETSPSSGLAAVNGDGTITYTHNSDAATSDSFQYRITDPQGAFDVATVTITIAQTQPPVAQDDSDTVSAGQSVTTDVRANDSDPDNAQGELQVTAITVQPLHGTAQIAGTGSVTYTHDGNGATTDSYEYRIEDPNGNFDTATVTLTIDQNQAPTPANDTAETDENTPVTIDVLANDSDPDGDPLTVSGATNGSNGSVVVNGDGTVTYTPDPGFSGNDNFTYTVSDGNGGFANAMVFVTVNPAVGNTAPDAENDDAETQQDTAVTIDVLANDSDPDGDPLTITGVTQGANGGVTTNGSDVTYTPDAGFTGSDSFTYTIDDGQGGSDTATVTVNVLEEDENHAPKAKNDKAETPKNMPVTIYVLTNDKDKDGDPLTITGWTQGDHGSVTKSSATTLTYSPNAGYTGKDEFFYSISDGRGGSDTAKVKVKVTKKDKDDDGSSDDDSSSKDDDSSSDDHSSDDGSSRDDGCSKDADCDGDTDSHDYDDDNDGIPDEQDNDIDGDGISNDYDSKGHDNAQSQNATISANDTLTMPVNIDPDTASLFVVVRGANADMLQIDILDSAGLPTGISVTGLEELTAFTQTFLIGGYSVNITNPTSFDIDVDLMTVRQQF